MKLSKKKNTTITNTYIIKSLFEKEFTIYGIN